MSQINNDITYQKYEEYCVQYIISLAQIELFNMKTSDGSHGSLDDMIRKYCYYNLPSKMIDDFDLKLKHNVLLARNNQDHKYLGYIQRKFHISDDLMSIDIDSWQYKPNLIKIKLKSNTINGKYKGFTVTPLLAKLLEVKPDNVFKYKSDIIRLVHKHIYENKLQDVFNPMNIIPDIYLKEVLSPLLKQDKLYTYLNLPFYLNNLILKIE